MSHKKINTQTHHKNVFVTIFKIELKIDPDPDDSLPQSLHHKRTSEHNNRRGGEVAKNISYHNHSIRKEHRREGKGGR